MARPELTRRSFASMLPALVGVTCLGVESVEAEVGPSGKMPAVMPVLHSNTFTPGPAYGSQAGRVSHRYLAGMLTAGNIRLEMHETIQEPGAEHEPVGTHLHNELWLVREGVAELFINGTTHRMEAGDIGLVCAGDKHWIRNAGPGRLTYFVVTLGPPE